MKEDVICKQGAVKSIKGRAKSISNSSLEWSVVLTLSADVAG